MGQPLTRRSTWDRAQALRDVLDLLGADAAVKRDRAAREAAIDGLAASDLDAAVAAMCAAHPALAPHLREVLVCVPPGADVNAYAEAKGARTRIVVLTAGFHWLQRLVVSAYLLLVPQVCTLVAHRLAAGPKRILPPPQALAALHEDAHAIAGQVRMDRRLREIVGLLRAVRDDPEVMRAAPALVAPDSHDPVAHHLAAQARRFALGHELAHHLLGHTARRVPGSTAPGRDTLDIWLAPLGLSLAEGPRDHRDEREADALGYLLAGAADPHTVSPSPYMHDLGRVAGAFFALTSLSLVDERGAGGVRESSDTHPSFTNRCAFVSTYIQATAAVNPSPPVFAPLINRTIDGHPTGFALQVWLVVLTLGRLIGTN